MNTDSIQQQITDLQTKIITDETTLQEEQSQLASLQAQLAQASTVNAIESITDLNALNSALEADNSPFRVVDSTQNAELPPATEPTA